MADSPGLADKTGETPVDPRTPEESPRTILLAEDETNVRVLIAGVLERQGFKVIEAPNGAEALKRAGQYPLPISLLITDVSMPLLSGPELVRQLLPLRPEMKVLFLTGRDKKDLPQGANISFLEKPFALVALLGQVRRVLRTG